jgi:peptide/nickel transport system substrate-binding protein
MKVGEVGSYGGRFVTVGNTAPNTFNPVTSSSAYTVEIVTRMFVRLMRVDPVTQEETPELATAWEMASDGMSCTFHLRRGAMFSDGHPITAADVVFSLEANLDPSVNSINRDTLMMDGQPFKFSAPDPFTVVVRAPRPNGSLVSLLQAVMIGPKHVLEPALRNGTFNSAYGVNTPPEQLVTSGAFLLKEYLPNERTVLVRNPYWFGVDAQGQRLPYLDELIFRVVPDQEATNLTFRAGEADTVARPSSADYEWYAAHQKEGEFTLYDLGPELSTWYMVFNLNRMKGAEDREPAVGHVKYEWFKHAAFRRAISSAIDRDAMIKAIYYGNGVKSWSSSTPGDVVWATPDVPRDDYDLDRARRLLASVGMTDRDGDGLVEDARGHAVTFSLKVTANNATRVAAANFIRDDLSKLGIKVILTPVEFNTLSVNINHDLQFEAAIIGHFRPRPGPLSAARMLRSTGNLRPWHRPQAKPDSAEQARVDWLLDHITADTDLEQRKRWWTELHTIANQQGWLIWLPVQTLKVPVRNRFKNVRPSGAFNGASSVLWNADEIFIKNADTQAK